MELKDRLQIALKESEKTQKALADACGVTHSAVYQWLKGLTKDMSSENAMKAASFLGVRLHWLVSGEGPMRATGSETEDGQGLPTGLVAIPEFQVFPNDIPGEKARVEEIVNSPPRYYTREWIEERGLDIKDLKAFRVRGDSMIPLLYDGDIILCDCREGQRILSGKVYAIASGGELRVKQLFPKIGGETILVRSGRDSSLPDETVDLGSLAILGRVIEKTSTADF